MRQWLSDIVLGASTLLLVVFYVAAFIQVWHALP